MPLADIRNYIGEQAGKNSQIALTTEGVQEVKEKITEVGSLEFVIVANNDNDQAALDAGKDFFKQGAKNPKTREDLERRPSPDCPLRRWITASVMTRSSAATATAMSNWALPTVRSTVWPTRATRTADLSTTRSSIG